MSDDRMAAPSAKGKAGEPYQLVRRTKHKREGRQLSGYALDITIRVNGDGAYFLQDHNGERNVMPHSNREDLVETLVVEIERNHVAHFGRP